MLEELVAGAADVAIVDMEAGLEHLSRSGGTLAYSDVLVAVMEPTRKAILTAARMRELADELGIPRTVAVGNKAAPEDAAFFAEAAAEHGLDLAGVIPADADLAAAERRGVPVTAEVPEPVRAAIGDIVAAVERADER